MQIILYYYNYICSNLKFTFTVQRVICKLQFHESLIVHPTVIIFAIIKCVSTGTYYITRLFNHLIIYVHIYVCYHVIEYTS